MIGWTRVGGGVSFAKLSAGRSHLSYLSPACFEMSNKFSVAR